MNERGCEASVLMREGVGDVFSGASALVMKGDDIILDLAVGKTAYPDTGAVVADVTQATVFDVASLTKPLVTTAVLLQLAGRGLVAFNEPLGRHFDVFKGGPLEAVPLDLVAVHGAGLVDRLPLAEELVAQHGHEIAGTEIARKYVLDRIARQSLAGEPGSTTLYSDLGFILLGFIAENVGGARLDRLFDELIARPLGLKDSFFVPLAETSDSEVVKRDPSGVAATEYCPIRERVIQGEVHDDNVWVMGGVAGHAGLFSTSSDIFQLARMFLDSFNGRSTVLAPELVRESWKRSPVPAGTVRVFGWDGVGPGPSSAGSHISPSAVGHLGFTGTSLWIDHRRDMIAVLLTNRVHPSRSNDRIRRFRPLFHSAVLR